MMFRTIIDRKKHVPNSLLLHDSIEPHLHITIVFIPPSPSVGVVTAQNNQFR